MSIIAPARLAEIFVDMADTLVDEFDLIEFLQKVTSVTSDLIEARAAGLLLADSAGGLQMMAASDERAQMLELFQLQSLEGPCLDCYRSGEPVVNADLRSASDRWPRFAPHAVEAGYMSVHAFPLRLRGRVIGAMNLFGSETGNLSASDARVVQALADVATIGLLQERAIRHGEVLSNQLQSALNSRVLVEQAKGALAQIHGESPDQAFIRLRTYCRTKHLRLIDVAQAVTNNDTAVRDLTSVEQSS